MVGGGRGSGRLGYLFRNGVCGGVWVGGGFGLCGGGWWVAIVVEGLRGGGGWFMGRVGPVFSSADGYDFARMAAGWW